MPTVISEAPGAVDIYTFDALAGQEATFDRLSGSNVQIGWQLEAPDSTVLFDTFLLDQQLVLSQTGTYSLTVQGVEVSDFGIYSFALIEDITNTWRIYLSAAGDTLTLRRRPQSLGAVTSPTLTAAWRLGRRSSNQLCPRRAKMA